MRKNRLKQLWREGKTAFGMWADLGSPAAVEAMAQLDLDWILLDGEHGAASYEGCFPLLQAMNGSQATSVIRVPAHDHIAIKRALDMGAEGVMVPYVRTAEEVRRVVAECRYPPVGIRGIGPFRGSKYETDFMDYYNHANQEIAAIVQIECVEAVQNLDAILAVPGLDAIFVGPADLSASMGFFPNVDAPEVQRAIDGIVAAAKKAKMPVGYYCGSGKEAEMRADQGFQLINFGNDMSYLVQSVRRELRVSRGQKPSGEDAGVVGV